MKVKNIVGYAFFVATLIALGKVGYSMHISHEQMEQEMAKSKAETEKLIAESKAYREENQAAIDKLYDKAKEASQFTKYSNSNKGSDSDYEYALFGGSHPGYLITKKKADNCAIVTGLTDKELRLMGRNLWEFKKDIKRHTGEICVLFK